MSEVLASISGATFMRASFKKAWTRVAWPILRLRMPLVPPAAAPLPSRAASRALYSLVCSGRRKQPVYCSTAS